MTTRKSLFYCLGVAGTALACGLAGAMPAAASRSVNSAAIPGASRSATAAGGSAHPAAATPGGASRAPAVTSDGRPFTTSSATAAPAGTLTPSAAAPCPPVAAAPIAPANAWERQQPKNYPIRAAFYYGYGSVSTRYSPTYGNDDPCLNPATPKRTVSQMRWAGLNAGIASWWGHGSWADVRIPSLLRAADGTPFRWALYYEPGGQSIDQIEYNMHYISERYTADKNYLRVWGKPVLFIWAGGADSCALVQTFVQANHGVFWLQMKNYYKQEQCKYQPNAYHAYGPAVARLGVAGNSYSISPGFWRNADNAPTLSRSIDAWNGSINAMKASGTKWQLITTFNEWGENSAVESAAQWRSGSNQGQYLDRMHIMLGAR